MADRYRRGQKELAPPMCFYKLRELISRRYESRAWISETDIQLNCGLSAVGDTETAVLSDKDPKKGDFIMYRTTFSDAGDTKYLWQRAKILSVGDPRKRTIV